MPEQFDLVIVGGGPGGYGAALYAAAAGLQVAVVEKDRVGGTCLHRGCIPAKEYLETAAVYRTVSGAKEYGVQAEQPAVDFGVAQARKQKIVDGLWKGLQGLLKARKVKTFAGTGTLGADRTVTVTADDGSTTQLTGANVILATGSAPSTIPGFEIDGTLVLTSTEVLALTELPRTLAIIGGGVIGCEFASAMADLGVQVTILEYLPQILPGTDPDCVKVVAKAFAKRGIDIRTGVKVEGHTPNDSGGTTVRYGQGEQVTVDMVVVSVGRRPVTEGLLGDGSGVSLTDRGYVHTDEWLRTGADGVYAIGDCVGLDGVVHPQLAHVGFADAILVVKQILGEPVVPVDYAKVPLAIYSHPEVASAGLTEQAARDRGIDVVVSKFPFNHMARALILGEPEGLVKLVAEKRPDGTAGALLGVHMVGPWVTEQLSGGYLAVNWEATPDEIAAFIQPHPTLTETFGEAVLMLTGRGLHG